MSELKIQTDREIFLRSIENWDGMTPSFSECMAGALLLAAANLQSDQFLTAVADEMKCSPLAVTWFVTRANVPPLLGTQKDIVDRVAWKLKACLVEADRLNLTRCNFVGW